MVSSMPISKARRYFPKKPIRAFQACLAVFLLFVVETGYGLPEYPRKPVPISAPEPSCDSSLPNHYIVLLDNSGTMDDGNLRDFWGKNGAKYQDAVSGLVEKALNSGPEWLPKPGGCDLITFTSFKLDFYEPSYDLDKIFFSDDSGFLLKRWRDIKEGQNYPKRPKRDSSEDFFEGHTPLIAATKGIFPYLSQNQTKFDSENAKASISRIFILRINDGDYNVNTEGDEYYGINDIIKNRNNEITKNRKRGRLGLDPKNYNQFLDATNPVNSLLNIGEKFSFCLLLANGGDTLQGKIDCSENAYHKLGKIGDQLVISYLEVAPRLPSLEDLAQVASTKIEMQREAHDDKVWWTGTNEIKLAEWPAQGHSVYGKIRVTPIKAEFWVDKTASPCKLNLSGQAADHSLYTADCEHELNRAEGEANSERKASYRFTYQVEYLGNPPVYPLTQWVSKDTQVDLLFVDTGAQTHKGYFGLPALPGFVSEDFESVTDKVLLSKAHGGRLKLADLADPKWYLDPQSNWLFQSIYFSAAVLLWLFWPQRRWKVSIPSDPRPVIVDFNQNTAPEVVVGQARLERLRFGLPWVGALAVWRTRLRLWIPHGDREVRFVVDNSYPGRPVKLAWQSNIPPLWIGGSGQSEHLDKRAIGGNSYTVLFDAARLSDVMVVRERGGQLADCVGDLVFGLESSHLPEPSDLSLALPVRVVPEAAKFKYEAAISSELASRREGGRTFVNADYGEGKPLLLATYTLRNEVRHQFSHAAEGQWTVVAESVPKDRGLPEGAFSLVPDGGELPVMWGMEYSLCKGDRLRLDLFANLELLGNPYEPRHYEIKIQDREGRTVEEFEFVLERSRLRTDLELELLDRSRRQLGCYAEDAANENPIEHDLSDSRIEVHSEGRLGTLPLLGLVLRNRCRRGHGHADWRLRIVKIDSGGQVECPERAVSITNKVGKNLSGYAVEAGGRLQDDPSAAAEELNIALDPRFATFKRRDAGLKLDIQVDCDKYPDGASGPKETLSWRFVVRLALRHIPPKRVLAIDFGTSAIAIAHAMGDEILRLAIASRIGIDKEKLLSQWLETSGNFLSADANLFQDPVVEGNHKPDPAEAVEPADPGYLALPARRQAILDAMRSFPNDVMVFPSLKMLLVRNYMRLPINPRRYPYLDDNGKLETQELPLLEDVLRGVFSRLREDYAHPLLKDQGKDYFYLVATHPNTYTAVERAWFRRIIYRSFGGVSEQHMLYGENIHLLSESDAVLNYYILNCAKLRQCDWNALPEKETVLIWDIGAGTLDMTLARVDRTRDASGTLGRPNIEILDRHGVEAAGNRLTECIARDLDQWLIDNLGKAYLRTIVENPDKPLPSMAARVDLYNLMLAVRDQIERHKRDVSYDMQLSGSAFGADLTLISTSAKDKDQYEKRGLRVDDQGNVYWQRRYEGKFIGAFVARVAKHEVELFLGNPQKHPVDTVIVSGRTALWPRLVDTLRETLPGVKSWVQFDDPEVLKNAVTEGAVISQTHWKQDVGLKAPPVFGEYVIRYERNGRDDWDAKALPDGKPLALYMPNAHLCDVGIRQSSKRFKPLFQFNKNDFHGDRLTLTMQADPETGDFLCEIKDETGAPILVNQQNAGLWRRPRAIEVWPLTRLQLPRCTPEEIANPETNL
jgi:hypothetical protein